MIAAIPNHLRPALSHAIESRNRELLNLIELALVREMKIEPSCACIGETWKAVGIAEMGRDLIIQWREKETGQCYECDGTGEIEAHGKTRTVYVECPECDGSGEAGEVDAGIAYTDIDGEEVHMDALDSVEFLSVNGFSDSLSRFIKENETRVVA